MKWDVDKLKSAARGRWIEILIAAGIPAELLDGRHHPCCKCGGKDRFRLIDAEAGAILCSQCFSEKNGDGIAAVQWIRDCSFQEALEFIAEFLGLKPEKRGRKDKPLEEKVVKVADMSESVAGIFGGINPGINFLGLQRMGAICASKGRQYVVAFPCIGDDLATLVNYVCMAQFDKTLIQYDKDGHPVGRIRKSTAAKGAGLLGEASLAYLRADQAAEICWKCEGPTDLAALLGVIPDEKFGEHIAVSNTHGAGESPGWQAEALARAKAVYIVHDRDDAGRAGAIKWAREIRSAGGKVRIVELPEDGQDLRDFIQGSGEAAYSRLLTIAEATEWFELEGEDHPPVGSNGAGPILREETKSILAKLGLDVLGENDRGWVKVYSVSCRKSVTIKNLARATRPDFAQICGYSALNCIVEPGQPATKGKFTLSDVREAIAVAASKQVIAEENDLQGPGLWANEGQVVLCNKHHLSVWDGSTFVRLESSRAAGMLFELGRFDWYDHGELEALLPKARDPEWCDSIWKMLAGLIDRWHWQRQRTDPALLAGLVGATLCQSVWKWRPQVAVTGETNSGKTSLLRFLFDDDGSEGRGVIGKLAFRSVGSSPAGVRQAIGRASRAIVMDEFDSQRSRGAGEFMKWLRAAGPGEPISLGTTNHQGISFTLRNVVWLAGIHVGVDDSADANRFLIFDQTKGTNERRAAWREPTKADRDYLRPALVAIAVTHCLEAARVAHEVAGLVQVAKVDPRTIRCMAAPAALMAVSAGGGMKMAEDLVRLWASERAIDEGEEIEATHDMVLKEVLAMTVEKGGGQKVTVGEIIFQPDYVDSEYQKQLEAQLRIAVKWIGDRKYLAVNGSMPGKKLEKSTASITQILKRLPGAKAKQTKIAGANLQATWIPWDVIEAIYQGVE